MTLAALPPWLIEQWRQLRSDRQHHAILLQGVEGLGKRLLADHLSAGKLCAAPSPDGFACGQCKSCHLIQAGSHPDLVIIEPDGKLIKVDQIRKLIGFVTSTSSYGRGKSVLIQPAEAMNIASANALLKTLEEPNGDCSLLLVAQQPMRLPATVRSRCLQLHIHAPSIEQGCQWLTQAHQVDPQQAATVLASCHQAPFVALDRINNGFLQQRNNLFELWNQLLFQKLNPITLAEQVKSESPDHLLLLISQWLQDLIRLSQTNNASTVRLQQPDLLKSYQQLPMVSSKALHMLLEQTLQLSAALASGQNPNLQIALESLFTSQTKQFQTRPFSV
ncbi:DNA polymerase III subunit delta' [Pelagibaculum spongiae]|uniref:DNA polymerase III subunit delta' n=1 Tax=Pelagibaculum spongiae TaxID=2080658 RepID=A0A2V1H0W1_9GAMM|nr:DNA polymerase III subunit delta' [Pelagibaculum spongiae]PVZ68939.1 DNA polymerase III subunit delta' [Pelagibaculum spongiae]